MAVKSNGKIAVRGEAAARVYETLIDGLKKAEDRSILTPEERKEVARRVRELEITRADAEAEVLDEREEDEDDEDEEKHKALAVQRHRSYLPFVRAGLMTVAEAVREVGANRSADGSGQERA